jgi:hypothetical protein
MPNTRTRPPPRRMARPPGFATPRGSPARGGAGGRAPRCWCWPSSSAIARQGTPLAPAAGEVPPASREIALATGPAAEGRDAEREAEKRVARREAEREADGHEAEVRDAGRATRDATAGRKRGSSGVPAMATSADGEARATPTCTAPHPLVLQHRHHRYGHCFLASLPSCLELHTAAPRRALDFAGREASGILDSCNRTRAIPRAAVVARERGDLCENSGCAGVAGYACHKGRDQPHG